MLLHCSKLSRALIKVLGKVIVMMLLSHCDEWEIHNALWMLLDLELTVLSQGHPV